MNLQNLVFTLMNFNIVLEAAVPSFLQPLRVLVSVILSGVGLWGILIIIKNVSEFATAFQSQDSTGMSSAVKGFIGGLMMAAIGAVLAFLGITY